MNDDSLSDSKGSANDKPPVFAESSTGTAGVQIPPAPPHVEPTPVSEIAAFGYGNSADYEGWDGIELDGAVCDFHFGKVDDFAKIHCVFVVGRMYSPSCDGEYP